MYLILGDGTKVCGTVDELIDFLNKNKIQHDVYTNKIYPGDGTGDGSYIRDIKHIIATGVCPSSN